MIQQFRILFSWIKFRLKSVNAHGLHSPFLFNLYYKLTDKSPFYIFGPLETVRAKMLVDTREIEVFDAGAGSLVLGKKKKRKVADIAKSSLKKQSRAELLFRIVNEFQCKHILELGTSLGVTTCYLGAVSNTGKVISIEASSEIIRIARENISMMNLKNITVVEGKFDDVLGKILDENENFDLVFLDGDHRYDSVIRNVQKLLPKMHNDSILIIDDIHWSEGMERAWQEIKSMEGIKVTVDVFDMGILFFRKEMSRENFSIRL